MTIMPLMERGLRAASGAQLRRDGYHVALFHSAVGATLRELKLA